RRHIDRATQRGGYHVHGHGTTQVIAVTLEQIMRPDVDLNIQISRRATVLAGFAFATQADAITAIDTRRHLDRQCLTGAHTTFTVAFFAGVAHLASLAMTVRTG